MATLLGDVTHREGGEEVQTGLDRNATRIFQVTAASVTESDALIIAATGVTKKSAHPRDGTMLAEDARVVHDSRDRLNKFVFFDYANRTDTSTEDQANPLNRRTKIRWSSAQRQKHNLKQEDRDGKPIATKAGEPFEGVPPLDDTRWVIEIEENVSAVPTWVLNFPNTVNSSAVTIQGVVFPPETLKLQNLRISDQLHENNTDYFKVVFQLHYRREKWDLVVLHQGLMERVKKLDANGVPVVPDEFVIRRVKASGDGLAAAASWDNPLSKPVPKPWPLDIGGAAIIDPQSQQADINFLTFSIYETRDFSLLPGVI